MIEDSIRIIDNTRYPYPRMDPRGHALSHCDAGSVCRGVHLIKVGAEGYTDRTMRLCHPHFVMMLQKMTEKLSEIEIVA